MQEPLLPPTEEGDIPEKPSVAEQPQLDIPLFWEQRVRAQRMRQRGIKFLQVGGAVLFFGIPASFGFVAPRYSVWESSHVSLVWPPNSILLVGSCLLGGILLLVGVAQLMAGRMRK